MIRSNPRLLPILGLTFVLLILLGWAYGDPWGVTVLRAFLGPVALLAILYLYSKESALFGAVRVLLGVALGAWCAWGLGGDAVTVALVALGFGMALIACEYLIRRGLREANGDS